MELHQKTSSIEFLFSLKPILGAAIRSATFDDVDKLIELLFFLKRFNRPSVGWVVSMKLKKSMRSLVAHHLLSFDGE